MNMAGMGDSADNIAQLCMSTLKYIAERDRIPEHLVEAMQFRADYYYDVTRDCYLLRIAWRGPENGNPARSMMMYLSQYGLEDENDLRRRVILTIDNINLRGELFFYKLHKHFPNRVEKVRCDRDGNVIVTFKNGRELSVSEQDLDSLEFLATCGMVYDL